MNTPLLGECLALFELDRRPMTKRELKEFERMKVKLAKLRAKEAARLEKLQQRRQKEEALKGNPLPVDQPQSARSGLSSIVEKIRATELLSARSLFSSGSGRPNR